MLRWVPRPATLSAAANAIRDAQVARWRRLAYLHRQDLQEATLSAINRFLGDTPLRVALKLLVLSFLVGIAMNALGWTPWDILTGIREFFLRLWNMGFEAIARFGDYILLGAAVVVPVFVILRILNYRRS
jgi:hypothetical protein